jgi:SSS family transporter
MAFLAAAAPASAAARETAPPQRSFGAANYAVLAAYLAVLAAAGVYFSRREKSTDDYFLASRRVPWWAAGLSIFAGGLSALTYMAVPAKAFATDWSYILTYILPVFLIPIVVAFYIPFYRRLRVTTAYEYLEKRFNLAARWFGSLLFILVQIGRMAIMLYLPAIAPAAVTDLNVYLCIALIGVIATLYTVLGGVEAVIWTDVLQVVVLAGGAVVCLWLIAARIDGGLAEIFAAAGARGKLTIFHWTWDHTDRIVPGALWVVALGSLLSPLMSNTADQSVVQRYLVTRDEKGARRAAWASALLGIPTGFLFFLLGTSLFVFYEVRRAAPPDPSIEGSAILPFFIMQQLPAGVSGLVIAGIFAAAMSTLDNGMNAIATAVTTDFYRRKRPTAGDRRCLAVARIATFAAGAVAVGLAMVFCAAVVKSKLDLFFEILGLFGSTLAALFVLGIFTRRTSARGALVGAGASAAVLCYVKIGTNLHGMLYAGTGLGVCIAVGYVASLILPRGRRDLVGLTVHTMPEPPEQ